MNEMTPTDRLIAAWMRWDERPGSYSAVMEKHAALIALGLPLIETHDLIAEARRGGADVADAVRVAVDHLAAA